ncbi:hypothetical protein SDC9_124862 [bioreactor metagenome]|uniref:Uncharacterized protein n=1 Tax=bioreactor metagenome TaxID=1076179 RepID=A0A645CLU3_9ZZZZ
MTGAGIPDAAERMHSSLVSFGDGSGLFILYWIKGGKKMGKK